MATPTSRRCPSPQNPFGAAKPREAVLAQRTGVKEEDILKADAAKDKLQARTRGREGLRGARWHAVARRGAGWGRAAGARPARGSGA